MFEEVVNNIKKHNMKSQYNYSFSDHELYRIRSDIFNSVVFFKKKEDLLKFISSYDLNIVKNINEVISFYYETIYKSGLTNEHFEESYISNVDFNDFKYVDNNMIKPTFLKFKQADHPSNIAVSFSVLEKDSNFELITKIILPFSKNCSFEVSLTDDFETIKNLITRKATCRLREMINFNSEDLRIKRNTFNKMSLEEVISVFKLVNLIKY